jgi:hypothetical protein
MMKVMIGLLLGVTACAVTGYVVLPKVKQTEYELGVSVGTKAGTEAGMAAGLSKGREQAKTEYKHEQDEVHAAARAKEEEQRLNAAKARKTAPKPIQNWHVRGNQIAEPIRDEDNPPV